MKAIVCTAYGSPDVLRLADVEKPSPKDKEVLIQIHATTVTSGDCRARSFECPTLYWIPMRIVLGFTKPRQPILGVEFSGVVESVGKQVTRFKPGDQVYGLSGMRFGAYAEYACMPEAGVMAVKPANVSFEDAAAVAFGATTALHFFRKGKLGSGQRVLIYGASGAVGTAAVQIAAALGAEVTGVCSTANMGLVKSLGASRVFDYTKEDFAASGGPYDLIFDAVGKTSKAACKSALAQNGTFVSVEGQGMAKELSQDLAYMNGLMEAGIYRPAIDRRYPLDQVPEAHGYVQEGRKKGNVVITVR
ncbi:NAD(P)-dependent alcohol dehydrogenase [Paenibacillus sp. LHD-117]|uniref:NAD(P)-dependent alcohol dehydrogenase n=1 Tax=Paenibacillus sp. LHD-117 TaxID=3071412 RepID=UPI0027E20EF2|nr:NAD(P)-dependent alcohol dehydrogenase [Paenibacillus sp. LHD-117]MDQ6420585.1 NAD(P)-dependent alcohol dehydrogenase [Paenibacillus sp. LHD-117]